MNNLLYNFLRVLAVPIVNFLIFPKVKNKKNMKLTEKCIVIANHTSYWDPVVLGYLVHPQNLRYMAKAELIEKGGFKSRFLLAMGIIPVNRGQGDLKAVKTAIKVLKDGGALGIFPEGKRSHDGHIQPFEPGVCVIAIRTRTPVLPVYLHGNGYKLFHRVRLNVGEQINLWEIVGEKSTVEAIDRANTILRDKMLELQREIVNGKDNNS